jgi:hypothetical protein
MFDGKFIATLFAIAVSIFAICNFNTKKITSHEGFGFNNLTYRKERACASNKEAAERGDFYNDTNCNQEKGGYQTVPNFQANISPRFVDNGANGPNVRYHSQNRSCDPLTFGGMAHENFTKESFDTGKLVESNYAAGNYNEISGQSDEYPDVLSMVPVGDMRSHNALGQETQSICYDRYIYANKKSNLRRHGCPIRGDMAITPPNGNWFTVSATVNDLNPGAIAVMAGVGNSSGIALADLINKENGNTAIAGVDMSTVDMSTHKNNFTTQNMSTVQVTRFV